MTGETICDLLKPLVGRSGTIIIVAGKAGQIEFAATENNQLTGVDVRADGLVLIERSAGWTVIDPGEVVALGWNSDPDHPAGQFL